MGRRNESCPAVCCSAWFGLCQLRRPAESASAGPPLPATTRVAELSHFDPNGPEREDLGHIPPARQPEDAGLPSHPDGDPQSIRPEPLQPSPDRRRLLKYPALSRRERERRNYLADRQTDQWPATPGDEIGVRHPRLASAAERTSSAAAGAR